jgi:hypothetical protein
MKRISSLAVGLLFTGLSSAAIADIPAGYKGTPFDPAKAGGMFNGMPTSSITTAGPYPIPGRLEFENHDMGGLNVAYFTTDHDAFAGAGYRTDDGNNEASFSATSPMPDNTYDAPNGDVYYDTGTALDGTTYPNATVEDVYVGAVRPGDWFNITVNVMTAGTYQVSSTWASGNGNPGKEGGDGSMELQVSVNGTMALDWKDVFPNYNTTANFHNWKIYSNMGTVTLQTGLQVLKFLSVDPHLNMDYIQFDLVGADGGLVSGGSGSTAGSGASSGSATTGTSTSGASSGTVAGTGTGAGSSGTVVASTGLSSGATVGESGSPASGSSAGGTVGGTSGASSVNPGTGVGSVSGSNGATAGTGGGSAGTGVRANTSTASSKGCAVGAFSDARLSSWAWAFGMAAALMVGRSRRARSRRPQ